MLAAAALVVIAGALWFLISLFQPFAGSGHGSLAVTIPPGASASQIGDLLEREGVVSSGFFFSLRARLEGKRGALRSGRFTLRRDMSYAAAIKALTTAPAPPPIVKLTIPEGLSRREIAPLAQKAGLTGDYLQATNGTPRLRPHSFGAPRGTRALEGFLFPATYVLKPHASVRALVAQQLTAFRRTFDQLDLRYARRKNLTAYDVLTIASMIEREAEVPRDRPLIAAVIYNRLHRRMQLGIDATIRYALNDWTRPLTLSETHLNSPYNTRVRLGLPPTPIGNPGLASLQAAAHPAHVGYLYYVVKPCANGGHAFSSTAAQFDRDVARYNAARRARGGTSPASCK